MPAKSRKNAKVAKNGNVNGNGNGANENFAAALTEVSDRLTRLVQDEIELAKTEVIQKASSLARGAAAVAAGAVFGVFAIVFFLLTLAWVLDGIFVTGAGSLWLGFLIVLVILLVLTVGAFLFAWKKLKVGAPTPKMAIDEGRKIKDTVTHLGNGNGNGHGNGHGSPERFASIVASAEIPLGGPALTSASTPAESGNAVLGSAPPVAEAPEQATNLADAPTTLPHEGEATAVEPDYVTQPLEERAEDPAPGDGPGAEH